MAGGMTSLRTVRLDNVTFDDTNDMDQFLKQVEEHKIPLRTFEFQSKDDDLYMEQSTNIDTKGPFPLQNLTSLAWCRSELYGGVKGNEHEMPDSLLSMFKASLGTLQSITLGPTLSQEIHQLFWGLRFPCLRSLKLGRFGTSDESVEMTVRFLQEHPNIEELDLFSRLACSAQNMFGLPSFTPFETESGLGAEALPRLKVLRCSVIMFRCMLQIGLHSLSETLETLELVTARKDSHKTDWSIICKELKRKLTLKRLREFSFDLTFADSARAERGEANDHGIFTHVAPFFARCGGAPVESVTLNYLSFVGEEQIIETLRPLQQLTTLSIPLAMFEDDGNGNVPVENLQNYVGKLALVFPRLYEVKILANSQSNFLGFGVSQMLENSSQPPEVVLSLQVRCD